MVGIIRNHEPPNTHCMDRLTAMQAFVRVVEAGTFTKAADSLELPKATVTRLIQTLETHLRTKLLNRTTRRVTVTPDGAAYYERVKELLDDIDELEGAMSTARAKPQGRIRVDVPSALGQHVLMPALRDFHERYSGIQIDLGVSDRPVDLIGDNVDCVIRGGELGDQGLVARRIGELNFVCCASPDYLKRHGLPLHPRELSSSAHRVVHYFSARTGRMLPLDFNRGAERIAISGDNYVVAVNDSNAYVSAGLAGLGVLQTPSFLVQEHLGAGRLDVLLADWSSATIPVHVVYPPNRHLSTKVRVFVDWVVELFENHDLIQRRSTLPPRPAQARAATTA